MVNITKEKLSSNLINAIDIEGFAIVSRSIIYQLFQRSQNDTNPAILTEFSMWLGRRELEINYPKSYGIELRIEQL